jgi:hypothetical protein
MDIAGCPCLIRHSFGCGISRSFSLQAASTNDMHVEFNLTMDALLSFGHLLAIGLIKFKANLRMADNI